VRVDVDLAAALGGSESDRAADTVAVKGTTGADDIAVDAKGAAVEVSGLAGLVRVTHADPLLDTVVVDSLAGDDDIALDAVATTLILVSIL
jgi:hypothetical protein